MAFPTLTIRFSPTSAWNAAAPIWSNVQAVTYDVTIQRGRQFELDKIEAGTVTLRLNNRAGDFWPDNAAGAYYPNVLPGKRVNVRATFNAVTYDLFTGFIESWFPLPLGTALTPEVSLTAADLLKGMATRKISNAGYAQALSGTRIGLILDDFGWAAADRDINAGKSQVQASGVLTDSLVRTLIDDVILAEQGYAFIRGDGFVVFHDRHARILSPLDTSQVTLGDDAGERAYFEPQFEITDAQVINHVSVTRTGGSSQVANDTTSQAAYGPRSEVRSGVILTTDAEALSQAQYRLARFKDAVLRLKSITLLPAADATNLFPQALGREIGDRITVRLDDASVDGAYHIEGIEHTIASQGRWRTVWQVSPADAQTYWKLGTAGFTELGTTTRLAW